MKPVLEVRNLSVDFSGKGKETFAAVKNISFSLYPGEVLGIVGESGSGKSTVARSAARLIPSSGGRILVDGQDITELKGAQLKEIYKKLQMVFQFPAASFDPRRTLGWSVEEILKNMDAAKEAGLKAKRLLSLCGLSEDFARRYPHQVSGGQCQRAAIARALAVDPKILICDEATSALDVTIQEQIIALLKSLKESRGLSMIFICHNLALVQDFCDRVLVMDRGAVVEEGTPDEIIFYPKTEYTRQLAASVL